MSIVPDNHLRNCENCYFLEWGYGDVNDPEGFMCNKREYKTERDESKHLAQLDSEKYRKKSKVCFEHKEL